MHEHSLIALSAILGAGFLCQLAAWRLRLPAILFLLVCGILGGPVFDWFHPDELFGDLLFPFISLAVAIILFEGGLTLRLRDIKGVESVIRNLITVGVLVTWGITTMSVRWLLGFSWEISFLFGAIMVVTGPTVIVPMLRSVRPKAHLANILRWEGILIDPIGATLAVLVYQFVLAGAAQGGMLAGMSVFGHIVAIGVVLGGGAGYLFGQALRRHWIPLYLQNFAALALVCAVFAVSNLLQAESGLLSVTIMAVLLANMPGVFLDEILGFKENLSIVLISMLFIILAGRMDLNAFLGLGWASLGVFVAIQFISRPISAQISSLGSSLTIAERHLLSWIAPRGIVAAAISALFAIRLEDAGFQDAPQMVPLAFLVIIGTVLLQSITSGPIARFLKVSEPEPKGFLLIGADFLARTIAEGLKENGFSVLLADRSRDNVNTARMQGFNTYYGNVVSVHADDHINLAGIGAMLCLTPNKSLNDLAARHYHHDFESQNVFSIRTNDVSKAEKQERDSVQNSGQLLFQPEMTRKRLLHLLDNKAELKTTLLTHEYSWKKYLEPGTEKRYPLFLIDSRKKLIPYREGLSVSPEPGWKVIGINVEQVDEG